MTVMVILVLRGFRGDPKKHKVLLGESSFAYQAVALYTLGHVLALQALSLPELLYKQGVQSEHCSECLQDFGPPFSLLVVDSGHLHRQAVGLRAKIILSLPLHLLHHLPELDHMVLSHLV